MRFDFPSGIAVGAIDDLGRFRLLAEQFDVAADLLTSDGLAEHHQGLVLTDHLAETLLVDHGERHFRASEVPFWRYAGTGRSYTSSERRQILRDFTQKVELASQGFEDLPAGEAILDEDGALVFLVGHRYRNAVYHQARYHPALIGALGRLYLAAVGRAFIRSQHTGSAIGGLGPERFEPFRRFGWSDDEIKRGWLEWRSSAERIVTRRAKDLETPTESLRDELLGDLDGRGRLVGDAIDGLRRDGLSDEQIGDLLIGAQAWAAHRSDAELLRIEDEKYTLVAALISKPDSATDAERRQYQELETRQAQRMEELKAGFSAPLDLSSLAEIASRGQGLRGVITLPALLRAYEPVDRDMALLEQAIGWVVLEWDRLVQQRIDEMRGK